MGRRIEVAIGVLVDPAAGGPGGRVLIARRPAAGVLGGYWEFPGGKREPGETLADCLVREFREELGLIVSVGEALPAVEHTYDHGTVRLHPFYCRLESGEPRALQVSEFRWVKPAELADYRFPPANADLVAQLIRELTAAG